MADQSLTTGFHYISGDPSGSIQTRNKHQCELNKWMRIFIQLTSFTAGSLCLLTSYFEKKLLLVVVSSLNLSTSGLDWLQHLSAVTDI